MRQGKRIFRKGSQAVSIRRGDGGASGFVLDNGEYGFFDGFAAGARLFQEVDRRLQPLADGVRLDEALGGKGGYQFGPRSFCPETCFPRP